MSISDPTTSTAMKEESPAQGAHADILLTTVNAKYPHAAFGLRYLYANMGDLRSGTTILEFDLQARPLDIVERLVGHRPKIIGMGVYIWNVHVIQQVVSLLRQVAPEVLLVLGGPEVSFEVETQAWLEEVDYVLTGEADLAFAALCRKLLGGERPIERVQHAPLPSLETLCLPYEAYTEEDVAHRILYVEASRGCPFTCEFCLSSLDVPVRAFPLEPFLEAMEDLWRRGVRQFKFVDRTFNLNLQTSRRILEFFRDRYEEGMFLHFEMIPDRLPEGLRGILREFPEGVLQFEIGIQTFDPETSERIRRRQNLDRLEDNFRFLTTETTIHLHADLIVGLPGEDYATFASGFDRLVRLGPQEIQVGILKRLRGTPIQRHDVAYTMVYDTRAPYEVLSTGAIAFPMMQRLKRFARYWDLIANSGNFQETLPWVWRDQASPCEAFMALSDWLYQATGRRHGIALTQLIGLLFRYLTEQRSLDSQELAAVLWRDYQRGGRNDRPLVLRPYLPEPDSVSSRRRHKASEAQPKGLKRQRLRRGDGETSLSGG